MSWLKRLFKKDYEFEIVQHKIPMSTICRWYIYDTGLVENPNEMAEAVGLTPVSLEGDEMERQDSDERIKDITTLFPFLESIAEFSSHLLTTIHIKEMLEKLPNQDDEYLIEQAETMNTVYKAVALSTLIGGVSAAVHLGLLHHDTVSAGVYDEGDISDEH